VYSNENKGQQIDALIGQPCMIGVRKGQQNSGKEGQHTRSRVKLRQRDERKDVRQCKNNPET
jgi:hypothetical protein